MRMLETVGWDNQTIAIPVDRIIAICRKTSKRMGNDYVHATIHIDEETVYFVLETYEQIIAKLNGAPQEIKYLAADNSDYARALASLQEQVNHYLAQGYKIHGNVVFTIDSFEHRRGSELIENCNHVHIVQAMIK